MYEKCRSTVLEQVPRGTVGSNLSRGFQDAARHYWGWWLAVTQLFELDDSRGFLQTAFLQLHALVTEGQHLLSITMCFLGMNLTYNMAILCSCWTWKAGLVYGGMFVFSRNLSHYWNFVQNLCSRKLPDSLSHCPWHLWRVFTRIFNSRNCSFKHKWELALQVLLVALATQWKWTPYLKLLILTGSSHYKEA